jgi:hypothetical protein
VAPISVISVCAVHASVLAQLEELGAAKVTELLEPGQVLLKLAVRGFGVRLPALS